ncbi:hypothetical protein [Lacrimispora sp.]
MFAPNSVGTVNCNTFNWNKSPTKYAQSCNKQFPDAP